MKFNTEAKSAVLPSARRKTARRIIHAGFCAVAAVAMCILVLAAVTDPGTEEYITLSIMAPEMYNHILMSVIIMSGGSFALEYSSDIKK